MLVVGGVVVRGHAAGGVRRVGGIHRVAGSVVGSTAVVVSRVRATRLTCHPGDQAQIGRYLSLGFGLGRVPVRPMCVAHPRMVIGTVIGVGVRVVRGVVRDVVVSVGAVGIVRRAPR